MFLPYFRWINNKNYLGPPHSPRPIERQDSNERIYPQTGKLDKGMSAENPSSGY
jgi:hypothetical protein